MHSVMNPVKDADEFRPFPTRPQHRSMYEYIQRVLRCIARITRPRHGGKMVRSVFLATPRAGKAAAKTFEIPLVATTTRSCRSIQITDCLPTDRAIWPALCQPRTPIPTAHSHVSHFGALCSSHHRVARCATTAVPTVAKHAVSAAYACCSVH
jgi:hypothetical protein